MQGSGNKSARPEQKHADIKETFGIVHRANEVLWPTPDEHRLSAFVRIPGALNATSGIDAVMRAQE